MYVVDAVVSYFLDAYVAINFDVIAMNKFNFITAIVIVKMQVVN